MSTRRRPRPARWPPGAVPGRPAATAVQERVPTDEAADRPPPAEQETIRPLRRETARRAGPRTTAAWVTIPAAAPRGRPRGPVARPSRPPRSQRKKPADYHPTPPRGSTPTFRPRPDGPNTEGQPGPHGPPSRYRAGEARRRTVYGSGRATAAAKRRESRRAAPFARGCGPALREKLS